MCFDYQSERLTDLGKDCLFSLFFFTVKTRSYTRRSYFLNFVEGREREREKEVENSPESVLFAMYKREYPLDTPSFQLT